MKTQATDWEKIPTLHISCNRRLSQCIQNSYNPKTGRQVTSQRFKQTLHKINANKHMKICSISPVIMDMQIKTTIRCLSTPTRMARTKKTNIVLAMM